MSSWHILSPELVIFVLILIAYMKIRQKQFLSIKVVKGLKTYVPPVEADFEMLEKTNKQARENTKGEVNKYDKKR
jgi:hypothetical protein